VSQTGTPAVEAPKKRHIASSLGGSPDAKRRKSEPEVVKAEPCSSDGGVDGSLNSTNSSNHHPMSKKKLMMARSTSEVDPVGNTDSKPKPSTPRTLQRDGSAASMTVTTAKTNFTEAELAHLSQIESQVAELKEANTNTPEQPRTTPNDPEQPEGCN